MPFPSLRTVALLWRLRRLVLCLILMLVASSSLAAAIWTNASSGLWRDSNNWSYGQAPNLGLGTTYLTNDGTKTVVLDAATPVLNLIINRLDLSAPAGATNTLHLVDLGTNSPLVISNNSINVYGGGALWITNSSLLVTGRFLSFNVWMGDVTLDDGLLVAREEPLTTNVTVVARLGRTNAAALTINRGLAQFSQFLVGESPGAQFARSSGHVQLNDGELKVLGELSIGDGRACTGSVNLVGGRLTVVDNQTNITRVADYGHGFLTISNAIASLGNVSVARHTGAVGLLTVLTNGLASFSEDLSIGRFSGATGTVRVAGGTVLLTNHPIWVGREGRGELIVSEGHLQAESLHVAIVPTNTAYGAVTINGGLTLVTSNFCVGGSIAPGDVSVAGGELSVTNRVRDAALGVISGSFVQRGGSITADNLFLTNANGAFTLVAGTLRTRGTQVSNGVPFVVGDGLQPATLELLGGTHLFADGLTISSNATLLGCGTVLGTVVNHGTIATNCGATTTPPLITTQPQGRTVTNGEPVLFTIVASGTEPLFYQWRREGTPLPGETNTTLSIAAAQPSDAGAYTVLVTNLAGATNSDPAVLRVLVSPMIVAASVTANPGAFSFGSLAGLQYWIEFKHTLNDAAWTPITNFTGTGSWLRFVDVLPLEDSRFYRIRVE